MNLAPIVLFVYNRPWHTQQTIEALQKNEFAKDSEFFIYSDAPRDENAKEKVEKVREYLYTIDGFKKTTIIERRENWGLANSIIDGVTEIINKFGKIIVLEDDLITDPYFLEFMNDSLELYCEDEDVFVISGYSPPLDIPKDYQYEIYLTHRSSSWGWATWKDEWNSVVWENEFYKKYTQSNCDMKEFSKKGGTDRPRMLKRQIKGKIDSWAIRRAFTQFLQKKYTVYPVKSLIHNIGHDGSGVHCGYNHRLLQKGLSDAVIKKISLETDLEEDLHISFLINKYHTKSLIHRIYNKLRSVLYR